MTVLPMIIKMMIERKTRGKRIRNEKSGL
jgi:hypothetical protein